MTLHLIKLCVGIDNLDDFRSRRARRAAEGHAFVVHTRQSPKRAHEIIDGGSLYWVIKGQILVRQKVLAIESLGETGRRHCEILLEEALVPTAPQPRRAFQGWRYFEIEDAPPDLAQGESGEAMPQDLAQRLREIGAW